MAAASGPRRRLPGICFHAPSGQDYVRLSGRMVYLGKHGDPAVAKNYDLEIQRRLANGRALPHVVRHLRGACATPRPTGEVGVW